MAEERLCPMGAFVEMWDDYLCVQDACAWWEKQSGRCAVATLAAFAAVSVGYFGEGLKSILCVRKPKKRKGGGDNGGE